MCYLNYQLFIYTLLAIITLTLHHKAYVSYLSSNINIFSNPLEHMIHVYLK